MTRSQNNSQGETLEETEVLFGVLAKFSPSELASYFFNGVYPQGIYLPQQEEDQRRLLVHEYLLSRGRGNEDFGREFRRSLDDKFKDSNVLFLRRPGKRETEDLNFEEFIDSAYDTLDGLSPSELAHYFETGYLDGDGDSDTQILANKRTIVIGYLSTKPNEFREEFRRHLNQNTELDIDIMRPDF